METLHERQASVKPADVAMIQYTSGTTDFPKGAMLTHYSLLNNAIAVVHQVTDVQIIGVPDAFFGEELLAVVRPKEGKQASEEELREFCSGQISHQKIPRYFQFVNSYPMTASGKVQKFILCRNAIQALGLEEVEKIKTA